MNTSLFRLTSILFFALIAVGLIAWAGGVSDVNSTSEAFADSYLFDMKIGGMYVGMTHEVQMTFNVGPIPEVNYGIRRRCSNLTIRSLELMLSHTKIYIPCTHVGSIANLVTCAKNKVIANLHVVNNKTDPSAQSLRGGETLQEWPVEVFMDVISADIEIIAKMARGIQYAYMVEDKIAGTTKNSTWVLLGAFWLRTNYVSYANIRMRSNLIRAVYSNLVVCGYNITLRYDKLDKMVTYLAGPITNIHPRSRRDLSGTMRPFIDQLANPDYQNPQSLYLMINNISDDVKELFLREPTEVTRERMLAIRPYMKLLKLLVKVQSMGLWEDTYNIGGPLCVEDIRLCQYIRDIYTVVFVHPLNKESNVNMIEMMLSPYMKNMVDYVIGHKSIDPHKYGLHNIEKRFFFGLAALAGVAVNGARISRLSRQVAKLGSAVATNSREIQNVNNRFSAFAATTTRTLSAQSKRITAVDDKIEALASSTELNFALRDIAFAASVEESALTDNSLNTLTTLVVDQGEQLALLITKVISALNNQGLVSEYEAILSALLRNELPPLAVPPMDLQNMMNDTHLQTLLRAEGRRMMYNSSQIGEIYKHTVAYGFVVTHPNGTRDLLITFVLPTIKTSALIPVVELHPIGRQIENSQPSGILQSYNLDHVDEVFLIAVDERQKLYVIVPTDSRMCKYGPYFSCDVGLTYKRIPASTSDWMSCMILTAFNYAAAGEDQMPCPSLWKGMKAQPTISTGIDGAFWVSAPRDQPQKVCGSDVRKLTPKESILSRWKIASSCFIEAGGNIREGTLDPSVDREFIFRPNVTTTITGISEYEKAVLDSGVTMLDAQRQDALAASRYPDVYTLPMNMSLIPQELKNEYTKATSDAGKTLAIQKMVTHDIIVSNTASNKRLDGNLRVVAEVKAEVLKIADESPFSWTNWKNMLVQVIPLILSVFNTVVLILIMIANKIPGMEFNVFLRFFVFNSGFPKMGGKMMSKVGEYAMNDLT